MTAHKEIDEGVLIYPSTHKLYYGTQYKNKFRKSVTIQAETRSRSSEGGIVTRPPGGSCGVQITERPTDVSLTETTVPALGPSSLPFSGHWRYFPHLVPRFRTSGAIPLLPHTCLHGADMDSFNFYVLFWNNLLYNCNYQKYSSCITVSRVQTTAMT